MDSGNPPITFDEFDLGNTITDDYRDQGVIFTSDVFTTEDTSNPTWPVLSGTPKFHGSIDGQFVVPGTSTPTTVNGFSLDVGYIDNRNSVVIEYLDSGGRVVGAQYAQSLGINHITISYRGIASFSVYAVDQEDYGFAIDNLVIDPVVSTTLSSMVSLGDSYTSGEGRTDGRYDCGTDLGNGSYHQDSTLPQYDPIWIEGQDCDTRTFSYHAPADIFSRPIRTYDNKCHRHGQAYPNLLAAEMHPAHFLFVACSGAITDNIGATRGDSDVVATPQHPQSPVNVAGGNTQLTDTVNFSAQRLGGLDPTLITIGVGGNDAKFRPLIEHCARPWVSDCKDGTAWADSVLSRINGDVFDRLVDTFSTLRSRFPGSTLLVFGYPQVVEPGKACGASTAEMDGNETSFLGGTVIDALNQAISDAAAQAGAYFADISRVTEDHGVCASDPWINGLRVGINGVEPESFHPNVRAHQEIGKFVIDHYTDGHGKLLVANPEPSDTIRPYVGATMHLATLTGTVQQQCGASCLQPAAACVRTCEIHVQGAGYSPGAQLQVTLHSDPVNLGSVVADGQGRIDTRVKIPAGTPFGLHWLAIDGPPDSGNEGTLGVNVYETAPVTRLHPPAPVVAPTAKAHSPVRKRVRAKVALRRKGSKLTVKVSCPRTAASSCRVTLTLRRKHGQRLSTLLTRRLTVKRGSRKSLIIRNSSLRRRPTSLRLLVTTTTSAGTLRSTVAVRRR